jgi:PAS domain S-box-containing protein
MPERYRADRRHMRPQEGVTAPQGAEDELREYAERMNEAERIAHFGVWRWDLNTGRVRWSAELEAIYGLSPGQFAGTVDAFLSYLHPADRDRVWAHVERAVQDLDPFVFEERIVRADGEERILLSQGRPLLGPDGEARALVGVCHDVTDRVAAERALGLSEQRLRAIVDYSPSLIAVKDLEGRYLMSNAETGRVLGMTPDEVVGRECTELFPTVAEQLRANDLRAVAEMEAVYDEAVLARDGELRTYLTVTFALPDEEGHPTEVCTIATDITERKEREAVRRERRDWEERVGSALREGRMLVYGQPVLELSSGREAWCELLVRMREPGEDGRVLQPDAFLPSAERFGLIQAIDVWMVEQALQMTSDRAPEINLSAVSLSDPSARHQIVALLAAAPEAAKRIVFEITETADPEYFEAAAEFAADLTTLGCGLALDDFGTGFGSFTYLRQLPLRYLKIDRSFVTDMLRSREDLRVVQSIIRIAESFGLRVIAEGVEDAATLDLLSQLGVDYAQGFHLGRPAPVELASHGNL